MTVRIEGGESAAGGIFQSSIFREGRGGATVLRRAEEAAVHCIQDLRLGAVFNGTVLFFRDCRILRSVSFSPPCPIMRQAAGEVGGCRQTVGFYPLGISPNVGQQRATRSCSTSGMPRFVPSLVPYFQVNSALTQNSHVRRKLPKWPRRLYADQLTSHVRHRKPLHGLMG